MGYWKSKVLPKIKRVFENRNVTKKAAAEACKSFDESKETINKELEEKRAELQPKVLEIYEASSSEIKVLVKERTEEGVLKSSVVVPPFLEELVKIEFPGSKLISEAVSKYGPGSVSSPVVFILEKVCTFLPVEEAAAVGEDAGVTEREVVVVEEEKAAEEIEKTVEETSTAPLPVEDKDVAGEDAVVEAPAAVPPTAVEAAKSADGDEAPKA